jgi:hypothetical protein
VDRLRRFRNHGDIDAAKKIESARDKSQISESEQSVEKQSVSIQ